MLSYEKHFKSNRADGRFVSSLAAYMEQLRHLKPELSLPAELTPEVFTQWQKKVAAKVLELLQMPEMTEQPAPQDAEFSSAGHLPGGKVGVLP